jgi:hypothetical protein
MAIHRFNPAARGYCAAYRSGEPNRCPGCGRDQWTIGRITAECAFCSTALPLVDGCNARDHRPVIVGRSGNGPWRVLRRNHA